MSILVFLRFVKVIIVLLTLFFFFVYLKKIVTVMSYLRQFAYDKSKTKFKLSFYR